MVHDVQPTPGNAAGCAIIPQRTQDKGGFVRTGHFLNAVDPVIDVSAAGVRELLRVLGWPSPEEHRQVVEEKAALAGELGQVQAERDELREFEQSAQYTLEHLGQKVRRKPGRKPKEQVEV